MRTLADRRNEQAKANADDRELESRTDRRRQQDAHETMLKGVANRLVDAKPTVLQRLELDEELLTAIATAQAIRSAPARNRQVNVVRQHLRALGPSLDALVRRLDGPSRGPVSHGAPPSKPGPAPSPAVQAWCERVWRSQATTLSRSWCACIPAPIASSCVNACASSPARPLRHTPLR